MGILILCAFAIFFSLQVHVVKLLRISRERCSLLAENCVSAYRGTGLIIFFVSQHEGGFSYREAWFHSLDESYPIKHEAERLPPPIVTDLNGDGKKEILVATHDAKIQVLFL